MFYTNWVLFIDLLISKLKTEIANLKSEKGYLQSKCHHLENRNGLLPSTSKVFNYLLYMSPVPIFEWNCICNHWIINIIYSKNFI